MVSGSFNLAYNCAESLYVIFLEAEPGGAVESIANFAGTFFESLSSISSVSPDWSRVSSFPGTFEEARRAILASLNVCKEIKKEWIDPHQVLIFRCQIGGNFAFNIYKLNRLRREISQLKNQLERRNLTNEERGEILRDICTRERQMIVSALFFLQLPSLLSQMPAISPWQTTALLVQRTASVHFHSVDAFGSLIQVALEGVSIAALGASLGRQLEVISSDNAAAQYIIFFATCISCLQIFYAFYACISAYSR